LDIEILRLKPDTRVADFAAVLETGARLDARCVLVAGNDPDETRLCEHLAMLADLARPYALTVCLEPMPWTDVRNFAQALRIVESAARDNTGVLIDPIHFDRGGSRPAELAGVAPQRLPYLQFCDAPAERPSTLEGLLHQARAERLPPGQGGLDLAALLRAVPRDVPLSLEVPMATLARTMPASARARLLRETTERWLVAQGLAG
ncbi:sugar phosphate isomerase/epimerase family protein, partial [Piscinibacter sp.]|uniref:sugar phosphate isomerase/epimerase family protein n=1 Tax=Piscinibacter sp. TaxID=1903157 RepID=UPI002F40E062